MRFFTGARGRRGSRVLIGLVAIDMPLRPRIIREMIYFQKRLAEEARQLYLLRHDRRPASCPSAHEAWRRRLTGGRGIQERLRYVLRTGRHASEVIREYRLLTPRSGLCLPSLTRAYRLIANDLLAFSASTPSEREVPRWPATAVEMPAGRVENYAGQRNYFSFFPRDACPLPSYQFCRLHDKCQHRRKTTYL